MKSFYIKLFSIVLIPSLGFIVYSNTFHCSFHFDDQALIVGNNAIKDIQDLQSIWNFLPCRFVFYLSLALNYHFYQLNVFSYHLVNLGVHVVSAILVWWLTLLTLSTPVMKGNKITQHANLIALFTGLIFVSHPVQTQGITYIMQRAASMATLFYLLALGLYVKSRLLGEQKSTAGLGKIYYIGSFITTIVAMFTKEITITLPLMIMLYEFSFLKTKKSFDWKSITPILLTIGIIPLTMFMTKSNNALSSQEMHRALEGSTDISSWHYLLTQFRVIVTYLRLLILPLNQNIDYDYSVSQSLFELATFISLLFLASILFLAVRLFSKYRLVSFSIFWFFLALLPESSIFPIKDVIFEHRLYLPLVGYSIFLVSGLYYLFGKNTITAMAVVLTIVIGCNSVLTYQRNKVWKDEFTLWDDAVRKSPHKARPYSNRGEVYLGQSKFTEAMSDFNRAIELDPNYADAYYNRGNTYYYTHKLNQAVADYNRVIELDPNYSKGVYNNRGVIYAAENNPTQAIVDFTRAIEINPVDAGSYNNRGHMYDKQGNFIQAMSDYNKAIELDPDFADAYNNRGTSFASQGNFTQAMVDFNKVIELDPKFAEAYDNLGLIYQKQGNYTQAVPEYSKSIEINPNDAQAYYNRGITYAQQGSFSQAMPDLTKSVGIDPNNSEAFNNRGLIYDKEGNYTQAVADYNRAIDINPACVGAYTNRGIIYAKQNNFTPAVADFTKAIELNPNSIEAYSNRGVIYAKHNNFTQAV